mgnify:CR=1 FL=1
MSLTLTQIQTMPEVLSETSELQWKIAWGERCYKEAKAQSELAWKIYNDAIDECASREEINQLYALGELFDELRKQAWRNWDNAKAQYLTMLN